ncbi:YcaO-like family protein [uncultured Tateyamaria sp.]|uniref:YcaO-like family protein n=1 Tax=Tateyamaria sp. 1078 TaxID=3417464 RepID=UPI002612D3AE|nr:YcaO-like family protein [uncultured Tateyamaria sp.]
MTTTHKSFTDGTHRIVDPAVTLASVHPHLAAMGITRVANVTGLDRIGIPVVNAYRPNARALSVSQGKGLTLDAAKASAVMEAVEGFHAEEIDLPYLTASADQQAKTGRLIDTDRLPYLHGTTFNRDRVLHWIEGRDLVSGQSVWLPAELVHTDYTLPRQPNAGCFVASTNGLASGNHAFEAQVHGICEVIERDAHTMWDHLPFRHKAATQLDLGTVTEPQCRRVIDALTAAGMAVGVWDMSGDVGVATFHCLITDTRDADGHSGGGAGTHLCREVALMRALTEAVQVRTNYITGARDDLHPTEYTPAGIARKNRYAQELMEGPIAHAVPFGDIPTHRCETLEEDLDILLTRLQAVGVTEVVAVDLAKPAFGIAVQRIVIPGLEGPHDHDDYCPGDRALRVPR